MAKGHYPKQQGMVQYGRTPENPEDFFLGRACCWTDSLYQEGVG